VKEGLETLTSLGNEYGTLSAADKQRLISIDYSKPLSDTNKAFLEKEADELYAKIPQAANNKAFALVTDNVNGNYDPQTYTNAIVDLTKLLSKVDYVFNADKKDLVADATKARDSLSLGLNSNISIAEAKYAADLKANPSAQLDLRGDTRSIRADQSLFRAGENTFTRVYLAEFSDSKTTRTDTPPVNDRFAKS
jgi:hypothetical protein